MKATPPGWPRASSSVFYQEPKAAIEWLRKAFGFEVRLLVEGEGGTVEHSELTFGEAVVMVSGTGGGGPYRKLYRSPRTIEGGITQAVAIFVDDVDAHLAQALAAGARVVRELSTQDYGEGYWIDRSYGVLDGEGHLWWFMQRIKTYGEGGA